MCEDGFQGVNCGELGMECMNLKKNLKSILLIYMLITGRYVCIFDNHTLSDQKTEQ